MVRIAILADVHGNVPALEAVIADLEKQGPDEILVGGDLVGRGPQGSRVTEIIRERGWPTIRGNHEDYLLTFRKGEIPEEWQRAEVWSAARWMSAELGEQDVAFLDALPLDVRSSLVPEVRLVHGTPQSNNEGIGPWTSERAICEHLGSIDEAVLVCAHTHRPLECRFEDGLVVNVGSVGLPFNRDPRAQYVILHHDPGIPHHEMRVEFRQVPYDRQQTLEIYQQSGFLEAGGPTALLLSLELRHAAPYLVPYMSWTEAEGRAQDIGAVDEFLAIYDPDRQREFFHRLRSAPAS
jgi:predicted phosphodiesterase